MTSSQREHLENLIYAAERHKKMYNPIGYKSVMKEAFSYYFSHNPRFNYSHQVMEAKVQDELDSLPAIKGSKRGKVTLWKVLFLLVIGVALAYLFMFLYTHRERYHLSVALMLIALFSVSGFLIFFPLLFSRRKKE